MLPDCLISFTLPAGISWVDTIFNKILHQYTGLKCRCKNPAACHAFRHSFIRKHTTVHMWDRMFCYAKSESSCCWIHEFPTATQNAHLNAQVGESSLCRKCSSSVRVKRSDLYSIPYSLAICSQCLLYHHKFTRKRLWC